MDLSTMIVEIEQHVDIKRPMDVVFEGVVNGITEGMKYPDGRSMDLKLERWPGGRWYRDLGDNTGHMWGLVQVIKPPTILEIYGPMFMSYPVAGHIELKLTEVPGGTRVTLRHRAIGMIEEMHRKGMVEGWTKILEQMKAGAES